MEESTLSESLEGIDEETSVELAAQRLQFGLDGLLGGNGRFRLFFGILVLLAFLVCHLQLGVAGAAHTHVSISFNDLALLLWLLPRDFSSQLAARPRGTVVSSLRQEPPRDAKLASIQLGAA